MTKRPAKAESQTNIPIHHFLGEIPAKVRVKKNRHLSTLMDNRCVKTHELTKTEPKTAKQKGQSEELSPDNGISSAQ